MLVIMSVMFIVYMYFIIFCNILLCFYILGLMGYMTKDPKFYNDPMLFDPNFPFKPHKY